MSALSTFLHDVALVATRELAPSVLNRLKDDVSVSMIVYNVHRIAVSCFANKQTLPCMNAIGYMLLATLVSMGANV